MNEVTNKKSFLVNLQNGVKNNYKIYVGLISILIFIFVIFQLIFYFKNKNILNSSLEYYSIKNNNQNVDLDIQNLLNIISKDKNFFGILSSLEEIKIQIKNHEVDNAYNNYLNLLENKKLSKIYKAAISLQGAYLLVDEMSNSDNKQER